MLKYDKETTCYIIEKPEDFYELKSRYNYEYKCINCGNIVCNTFHEFKPNHILSRGLNRMLCRTCKLQDAYNSKSKERKQEIRDKTVKTLNKKYGENINSVGDLNKINEIREKSKQTKQERYGDPNYNNSEQAAKTKANWTNEQRLHFLNAFHKTWNSKTKEEKHRPRIKAEQTFKNNHNGMTISEYISSEEYQNKIKNIKKDLYNDPNYNNKEKQQATNLELYNIKNYMSFGTPEMESFMKNKYGDNWRLKLIHQPHTAKYNYYGILLDSSLELAVWIYYTVHKINIFRTPIFLKYFDIFRKEITYYPDFYIEGIGYVEIKGDQFFDNNSNMKFPYKKPHHNSEPYTEDQLYYLNDLYERKRKCAIENGVKIWRKEDIWNCIFVVKNLYSIKWKELFKSNNPYNPTYSNPNGYYNITKPYSNIPIYYTPLLYNNTNNKIDNDGYIILDNNKGITPYDIGRKR